MTVSQFSGDDQSVARKGMWGSERSGVPSRLRGLKLRVHLAQEKSSAFRVPWLHSHQEYLRTIHLVLLTGKIQSKNSLVLRLAHACELSNNKTRLPACAPKARIARSKGTSQSRLFTKYNYALHHCYGVRRSFLEPSTLHLISIPTPFLFHPKLFFCLHRVPFKKQPTHKRDNALLVRHLPGAAARSLRGRG